MTERSSRLFARQPRLRWLVPLLAIVLLASAGSVVAAVSASARDTLPRRSAAQLLVDVQKARVAGLSGTVVQTSDLGLPSLPDVGGSGSEFSSMLTGSHTLRVWYAGPEKVRVSLMGQLGESDLVRNGSDVWLWSSTTNTARHLTVPAGAGNGPLGRPDDPALTPQQAADMALKAITPTTRVSTDATAVVAGRPAYELVLEPKGADAEASLIGSVRIAIDGATHIPTRVQVIPRGSTTPAFEVGFTSFDPTVPSDSVFSFNPPPGATVKQGAADLSGRTDHGLPAGPIGPAASAGGPPSLVGSGWTTVVTARLPGDDQSDPAGTLGPLGALVKRLPTVSGSWGSGHLLRGRVFSVLLTDDGRVVAGAVTPDRLYAALASP